MKVQVEVRVNVQVNVRRQQVNCKGNVNRTCKREGTCGKVNAVAKIQKHSNVKVSVKGKGNTHG